MGRSVLLFNVVRRWLVALAAVFAVACAHGRGVASLPHGAALRPDSVLTLPDSTNRVTEADRLLLDSLIGSNRLTTDSIAMAIGSVDSLVVTEGKKERFVPSSRRAMWLGIFIPGGGQVYNRKYWKLPIFYGGFLGCLYALNWNNQMYHDYRRAYLDIMDNDPNTNSYLDMLPLNYDITGKEDRFKDVFRRKKDYYRRYRDMSIFCMIGVWALSVIDAYVDAELSTFDLSRDLSLHVAPGVFNSIDMASNRVVLNTGVKVGLRF